MANIQDFGITVYRTFSKGKERHHIYYSGVFLKTLYSANQALEYVKNLCNKKLAQAEHEVAQAKQACTVTRHIYK